MLSIFHPSHLIILSKCAVFHSLYCFSEKKKKKIQRNYIVKAILFKKKGNAFGVPFPVFLPKRGDTWKYNFCLVISMSFFKYQASAHKRICEF